MKKSMLIILVLGILLISGCDDDSFLKRLTENRTDTKAEAKAPGCEGPSGITGCMGKSFIKDINIEPSVECLKIDANNCNGGVLEIENKCNAGLEIGGKTIAAGSHKLIEFVKNYPGSTFVIELKGNFDSYTPLLEDTLTIEGKLGEQDITLSYLKENVCGDEKFPKIGEVYLTMDSVYEEGESVEGNLITYDMLSSQDTEILFTGYPAFNVYQLVDDEWQKTEIHDMTGALSCFADESEICVGPSAPAQLPEHCQEFDPMAQRFEWDQTVYKTRDVACGEETMKCSYTEKSGPGRYKFIFKYTHECMDYDDFSSEKNNIEAIEKEFEIFESGSRKKVIKWYGRTDEPIDEFGDWVESCSPDVEEAQEENPGMACGIVMENCFDEDDCERYKAEESSMAGCCRCEIVCV